MKSIRVNRKSATKSKNKRGRVPGKKRNRRQVSEIDQSYDDCKFYDESAEFNSSSSELDYCRYSESYENAGHSKNTRNSRMSREERLLQYYIGSIEKQEQEEKRKKEKKEKKLESTNNAPKKRQKLLTEQIKRASVNFNIVEGSNPELEGLALSLKESLQKKEEGCQFEKCGYKYLEPEYDYKEDCSSNCQSDDHSESTNDKLRTPTQNVFNISSSLTDDPTSIDAIKISNLLEKSSVSPSENEESEGGNLHSTASLKEEFCARLMRLTREKQNTPKKNCISKTSEGTQTPKNCINRTQEFFKPVFKVTSSKRKGYMLAIKNAKASLPKESPKRRVSDNNLFKIPERPNKAHKGFMII